MMTSAEYARLARQTNVHFTLARRRGLYPQQPCIICGDDDTVGHHYDYRKPFDVWWLCARHHGWQHRHPRGTQHLGQFPLVTETADVYDTVMKRRSGRPPGEFIAACGTVGRYHHVKFPCRCPKCKEAWRVYQARYRAKKKS
jgi:hypothetical protein